MISVIVSPATKPTPKLNTLVQKSASLQRFKYFIAFQMIFGINRLYLLHTRNYNLWLSYFYNCFTVAVFIYFMTYRDGKGASYLVFKDSVLIENILLTINSLIFCKDTLNKFFVRLASFDDCLNIKNSSAVACSLRKPVLFLSTVLLFTAIECVLLKIYIMDTVSLHYSFYITYLAILAHDTEIIFFCAMLIMICGRVRVLKGHVAKLFTKKRMQEDRNILEDLSYNADLDVSSLHKAYDLLHNCSEKLNSAMNLPMIIIFAASGLSSIMLLRSIFGIIQTAGVNVFYIRALICYTLGHCVKYTVLVIMPCYYANITTTQVTIIRTMLHDAINTINMDKIERRKLKAFFQLTRDCDFSYVLWSVIRMDMSLPLNYCSMCVTYLIIVVQFSRFID